MRGWWDKGCGEGGKGPGRFKTTGACKHIQIGLN